MPRTSLDDILEDFKEYTDNRGIDVSSSAERQKNDLISSSLCAGWVIASDAQYSVINYLRKQLVTCVEDHEYNSIMDSITDGSYLTDHQIIVNRADELFFKLNILRLVKEIESGKRDPDFKYEFMTTVFDYELYPKYECIEDRIKAVVNDPCFQEVLEDGKTNLVDSFNVLRKMLNKDVTREDIKNLAEKHLEKLNLIDKNAPYEFKKDKNVIFSDENAQQKAIIDDILKEQKIRKRAMRLIYSLGGIHKTIELMEADENDYIVVPSTRDKVHKDDVSLALIELNEQGLHNPLKLSKELLQSEIGKLKQGLDEYAKSGDFGNREHEGLICFEGHDGNIYRYSIDDLKFMLTFFGDAESQEIKPENNLAV